MRGGLRPDRRFDGVRGRSILNCPRGHPLAAIHMCLSSPFRVIHLVAQLVLRSSSSHDSRRDTMVLDHGCLCVIQMVPGLHYWLG